MPAAIVPAQAALLLQQSPIPALRKLKVEECDHEVAIKGEVGSYYLKQLAQETLMPVLDGRRLNNQVTVKPSRVIRNDPR